MRAETPETPENACPHAQFVLPHAPKRQKTLETCVSIPEICVSIHKNPRKLSKNVFPYVLNLWKTRFHTCFVGRGRASGARGLKPKGARGGPGALKGKRCHEAGKERSGARMGLGAGVVVWGGGGSGNALNSRLLVEAQK